MLSGNRDGECRLWNALTGAEIGRSDVGAAGVVMAAFSRDGERIVVAENFPKYELRLWNVRTGAPAVTPASWVPDTPARPTVMLGRDPGQAVPTVVLVKDGREVDRIAGYTGPESFLHLVNRMLASSN